MGSVNVKDTVKGTVATAFAAGLLIFGAAACTSSDDDSATDSSPPSATSVAGETHTEHSATSSPETSPGASPAASAPTVRLDGRAVDATFEPTRCEWGTDDGRPQLEFDAGSDSTGGDLDVELVTSDPPMLDDLTLETGGTEWEATSDSRRDAQITVDGDKYRIASQVAEDDGTRTAQLEVEFTCAKP